MANSKGPSSIRNMAYNGKHSLLPPKSPFPSVSPSYVEFVPSSANLPKSFPKPKDGYRHQRTSSESFLIEEQPSWLDDLLNEPETPVRKGHRRSSSDSFTFTDAAHMDYATQDDMNYRNMAPLSAWGSHEFDNYRDASRLPYYMDPKSLAKQKNWTRDPPLNKIAYPSGVASFRDNISLQSSGTASAAQETGTLSSSANERQEPAESGPHDPKLSSEKKDSSKLNASETDTKRAKQQFAQRSRVRKLQYIAELERNVQALQDERSEVSAELEFLNQQILILSMENKALKQRLESLAQEQLIKHFEHELLDREIGRLRTLYQQQQQQQLPPAQQQQQQSSTLRRTSSKDLDQELASLSLKSKDARTRHDQFSGSLHI